MSSENSEVLFFLGAGASVAAKVPDTYGIVSEFTDKIRDFPDQFRTISRIMQVLREHQAELRLTNGRVDVELLLEALERLEKRDHELVLWFHESCRYLLRDYPRKRPLKEELQEFIRSKALVQTDSITYLEPLLQFIEEHGPLDVFSVNYDTCIEQFCDAYGKSLEDGFDTHWNFATFKRDSDVRLYKLHGSVTWYRSDHGNYLKLAVRSVRPRLKLASGETAESLILFPMRKWEYAEPMLELLVELKRKLEAASYVFVVGYSFRDEHIRRLFWDAARKNKKLTILFVSPSAIEIYAKRLRLMEMASFSAGREAPSPLEGRVICLPYRFEEVLPKLKNYYLTNLRKGQNAEKDSRQNEVAGASVNWSSPLMNFLDCEHISKAKQLLEKVRWKELDWSAKTVISFKMRIIEICHRLREEFPLAWTMKFLETPYLKQDGYVVEVMTAPQKVNFNIRLSETAFLGIENVFFSLDSLDLFLEIRVQLTVNRVVKRRLERIRQSLSNLRDYLAQFRGGGIDYPAYVEQRKETHREEIAELETLYSQLLQKYDALLHERTRSIVTSIEQPKAKNLLEESRLI